METRLEFKPFVRREGVNYKIIQITDITLHSNKGIIDSKAGNKAKKAFDYMQPGRIYSSQVPPSIFYNPKEFIIERLKNDPSYIEYIRQEEQDGYKILLSIPKEGVPIKLGKDSVQFIESDNGQRVIRKLSLNNQAKLK